MFLGSNILLIFFIKSIPVFPISSSKRSIFPRPIPCSPVHVPFKASACLEVTMQGLELESQILRN